MFRRTLLKTALLGAAGSFSRVRPVFGIDLLPDHVLRDTLPFQSDAQVYSLGKAYLQTCAAENDLRILDAMISRAMVQGPPQSVIGQEFADNNVAVVDGWILSRTEARHYALRYLMIGGAER